MATAEPVTQTQTRAWPTPSELIVPVIIILLALIVDVGLVILIIWLTIQPKKLVYSIDDGFIHNYNLSCDSHLDATYNFNLRAYNPNKKVSVYYNKFDITILYDKEVISRGTIEPFYQPKRNETHFKLNLALHDVVLLKQDARDLKLERSSGHVEVDVKLKARVRFKVGAWKSRHYHMKVSCAHIKTPFSSSSKIFQRTTCDVDF